VCPVLADVVEGAQATGTVADHHDRHLGDRHGDVVAGFGQSLDMADPLPGTRKDAGEVGRQPSMFGVGLRSQRHGLRGIRVVSRGHGMNVLGGDGSHGMTQNIPSPAASKMSTVKVSRSTIGWAKNVTTAATKGSPSR